MKNKKKIILVLLLIGITFGVLIRYRFQIIPPLIAKIYYSEQTEVANKFLNALQENDLNQISLLTNDNFKGHFNKKLSYMHDFAKEEDFIKWKVVLIQKGPDQNPNEIFIDFSPNGYLGNIVVIKLEYDKKWLVSSVTFPI